MEFTEKLLQSKQVSVWGIGYLGYTITLKLHSLGFKVKVYDFNPIQLRDVKSGQYPTTEQQEIWSQSMDIPKISFSLLKIAENSRDMFDTDIHIVGFPAAGEGLRCLTEAFIEHKDLISPDSLVVFQAAETPGNIDLHFISPLREARVECSVAAALRSDWTINEFLHNEKEQVLAACSSASLAKAKVFYELIGQKYSVLSSIKEAELYENARNSLHYLIGEYTNQLALAFPKTNIRKMTNLLARNINSKEIKFRLGAENYKMVLAIEHMLNGAKHAEYLTLIKEAQNSSLSLLLSYADFIVRKEVQSVCILGLSSMGDQKDLRFSPSIFLAEYLNKKGISVAVHDPFFNSKEILEIMPFATPIVIEAGAVSSDVVILMSDHSHYKALSRQDLDDIGISRANIILDNAGVFEYFSFLPTTIYHLVGDGAFGALE